MYKVQTFLRVAGYWEDAYSYPNILEAVSGYKFIRSEYPDSEFRIIQVLEVE